MIHYKSFPLLHAYKPTHSLSLFSFSASVSIISFLPHTPSLTHFPLSLTHNPAHSRSFPADTFFPRRVFSLRPAFDGTGSRFGWAAEPVMTRDIAVRTSWPQSCMVRSLERIYPASLGPLHQLSFTGIAVRFLGSTAHSRSSAALPYLLSFQAPIASLYPLTTSALFGCARKRKREGIDYKCTSILT